MAAMTVKVSDQISALDVSILCPNVTVAMKTVWCVLTSARGTDLTARFNYNATIPSHIIDDIPSNVRKHFGAAHHIRSCIF